VTDVRYDPDVTCEYGFGNYLVRVDGGVIEQFARMVAGSYRVPVAWAAAEFEHRKHDVVRVRIGVAADPAAAFFSGLAYTNTMFSIEIPASEALRLRDFLSRVARDAGRVPGDPLI
jgi:hypothetical protein